MIDQATYHERTKTPRRQEDRNYEALVIACERALRLKTVEGKDEVLRWALESVKGDSK